MTAAGWRLDSLRCASTGLDVSQRSERWLANAHGPDGAVELVEEGDPVAALNSLVDTRQCVALDLDLDIRIGMECGPVVADVIGRDKFSYDLWGDTVNTASRLESLGLPGRIQAGVGAYQRLSKSHRFEERGEIEVNGKGV